MEIQLQELIEQIKKDGVGGGGKTGCLHPARCKGRGGVHPF